MLFLLPNPERVSGFFFAHKKSPAEARHPYLTCHKNRMNE